MLVGRWVSFWEGLFSGSMLNFRGVHRAEGICRNAIAPEVDHHFFFENRTCHNLPLGHMWPKVWDPKFWTSVGRISSTMVSKEERVPKIIKTTARRHSNPMAVHSTYLTKVEPLLIQPACKFSVFGNSGPSSCEKIKPPIRWPTREMYIYSWWFFANIPLKLDHLPKDLWNHHLDSR